MARIMLTPPPGVSEKEIKDFYNGLGRYFKIQMIMMCIAGFLFIVLMAVMAIGYTKNHKQKTRPPVVVNKL